MCQQSISSVSESRLKDRLTQKVASKGAWQASVLANERTARDLWVVKPDVLGVSAAGHCNTAHCARHQINQLCVRMSMSILQAGCSHKGTMVRTRKQQKIGALPPYCVGIGPHIIGIVCADALLANVGNELRIELRASGIC